MAQVSALLAFLTPAQPMKPPCVLRLSACCLLSDLHQGPPARPQYSPAGTGKGLWVGCSGQSVRTLGAVTSHAGKPSFSYSGIFKNVSAFSQKQDHNEISSGRLPRPMCSRCRKLMSGVGPGDDTGPHLWCSPQEGFCLLSMEPNGPNLWPPK